MNHDLEYVRLLAGATLPGWVIVSANYYDLRTREWTSRFSDTIVLSVRAPSKKYQEFVLDFFTADQALAERTARAVDHIQDHAIEATWGEPLPPCPGHVHPLVPRVVGGVPQWVCLKDGPEHHAQDIVPNFDPSFETPEEYLLLRERPG